MSIHLVELPGLKPHYTAEEAALITDEVADGNPFARTLFREAMVVSDLPLAFTNQSNRALLPVYQEQEPIWKQFSREQLLKDLRPASWVEVWPDLSNLPKKEGGRNRIKNKAPKIPANTEFPAVGLDESSLQMTIDKYGLRLPLTLEMIINDELDIIGQYPQALAVFMRLLEDIVTAEALIEPNGQGPRALIPRLAATGATTANAPLGIDSISAAISQIENQEVHGVRTGNEATTLLVPRQLGVLAKQLVGLGSYEGTIDGKTFKSIPNPAAGLKVIVFDVLTQVDISATAAQTWYVLGSPKVGRPTLSTGFLRGRFRNPQMYISSPNALTPAGGLASWKDGSFINDSIEFKARHFTGAALLLAEAIVVSTGTGQA